MTQAERLDTEELIDQARRGEDVARQGLLARYRGRLRGIIAARLDRRLSARLDPSDVVQDVLIVASRALTSYLERPALPFGAWLRQFAGDRLVDLHRKHVRAGRRSVAREVPRPHDGGSGEGWMAPWHDNGPHRETELSELRGALRDALMRLSSGDRELLTLRHLEQRTTREAAQVLGISEGALRVRHVRALRRLRDLLDGGFDRSGGRA
jgi:RNA polymerase sigma-70 factor (ECF subfamily)